MHLHLHLEEQITLLKPWFCLYNFSQILSKTLTLKVKVRHYDRAHFFARVTLRQKFFMAFLDELGNFKPFEPYFFLVKSVAECGRTVRVGPARYGCAAEICQVRQRPRGLKSDQKFIFHHLQVQVAPSQIQTAKILVVMLYIIEH